ncbi:UNVERIFIED_CONTAM: hypothetical protein Slati_3995700 [Sesamum latifolium]|uniref:Uncharacterized protein n=1 Tax=Sesamum latifolium TaxID=2727402 RepID=A0AAW2TRC6_9LAMI
MLQHGLGVKVDDNRLDELHDANCSHPIDEPYVGQEFESEAAAHAFITLMQQGLVLSSVSASFLGQGVMDAIGRALVCTKRFRMPTSVRRLYGKELRQGLVAEP